MKKLSIILFLLSIHSFVQSQDMKGMPMIEKSLSTMDKQDNVEITNDTVPPKKQAMDMNMDMSMPKTKDTIHKSTQNTEKVILTPGKTIIYHLYVADTMVNYTGKKREAMAINGTIPAPTLYFTEGDTAEIYVHNNLKEETMIHWHGVILPNQYDGVPYLTTQPIKPGQTHLFKFPIVQNGTYWYHSHAGLQEHSGLYGALIFYKRKEPDIKQYTLVLSDWADMMPYEINRSLRNRTDWFAIKKGATQSYGEAIQEGHFKTRVTNEWKRMTAMDVSDVAYDRFLINGMSEIELPRFKAGDKVKLRIVNGGASSYFWLNYAGGKITVVGNDGNEVEPVEVDRLLIAVAETYDVIVTVPGDMSYEFLATPEDRTKSASLWLGKGMKLTARHLPKLKYFDGMKMMNGMMKMNGNMKMMDGMQMSNQTMDMNSVMYPEIAGDKSSRNNKGSDTIQKMKMDKKKDGMAGMDMGVDPALILLHSTTACCGRLLKRRSRTRR